jgi:D-serine deaminase-like pyridoxal phosphate-dependent protein
MDISGAAASGSLGIGVGSAWQASAAMASGIQRVLMVNQLVGKANMQVVAQLKAHYRTVDFICCVDSEVNVRASPRSSQTRDKRWMC